MRVMIAWMSVRSAKAARRIEGVGSSHRHRARVVKGATRSGRRRKPSATTGSRGSWRRSSTISSKASPWNQWKLSSIARGLRVTQRWSMSMVEDLANWGPGCDGGAAGVVRHGVVRGIDTQTVIVGQSSGDRGLTGT